MACRVMDHVELDADALRADVIRVVSEYASKSHFRTDHHDGGWSAIGLIAHDGNPFEDRRIPPFKKTPALSIAPNLERLIDGIPTTKGRVRLMQLKPGASVLWHYDKYQSVDGNMSVRLHVPVITSPRARLQISHEDMAWRAGEIWYGDFSFPHRLYNGGAESRIHLVIDLDLNDSVLSGFPQAFLEQRDQRLRVKPACQNLLDLYAIPRLPRGRRLNRLRTVLQPASMPPRNCASELSAEPVAESRLSPLEL
jgi:quercetin dioxygenase-like cupin family protein